MKAYFLRLRRRDEFLWQNILLVRNFRAWFERILMFDDYHLVGARRIWTRESRLAGESSELPRTPCAKSSTLYPLTTYLDEHPDNGDKHESRWRNRLPRDNLPNVQLQTFRRRALAMAVLAREKIITFMTSLRKNVLVENVIGLPVTIEAWSVLIFNLLSYY